MADSLAIASEPLRNGLAASFADDREFFEFRTPKECVEKCGSIMSRPAVAAALREASWRYYESGTRPARDIANLLEQAYVYATNSTPNETEIPQ
jgi:hypothetical protein